MKGLTWRLTFDRPQSVFAVEASVMASTPRISVDQRNLIDLSGEVCSTVCMAPSRALVDELERQVRIIERLWTMDPPAFLSRSLRGELGQLEGEVRHLLLRARVGVNDDDVWAQALRFGRRLDRLRSEWHRDPLAA